MYPYRTRLTNLVGSSGRKVTSNAPPTAPRTMTAEEHQALAERQAAFILRCGALRRGEIVDDPPPIDSRAEEILKLGRRRRGEKE
jgi:hypothetical protein